MHTGSHARVVTTSQVHDGRVVKGGNGTVGDAQHVVGPVAVARGVVHLRLHVGGVGVAAPRDHVVGRQHAAHLALVEKPLHLDGLGVLVGGGDHGPDEDDGTDGGDHGDELRHAADDAKQAPVLGDEGVPEEQDLRNRVVDDPQQGDDERRLERALGDVHHADHKGGDQHGQGQQRHPDIAVGRVMRDHKQRTTYRRALSFIFCRPLSVDLNTILPVKNLPMVALRTRVCALYVCIINNKYLYAALR